MIGERVINLSVNGKKILKIPTFPICAISFIFLYALFAMDRIKGILAFTIEGRGTTNELWLIPLLCFLAFIKKSEKSHRVLKKHYRFLGICIFMYSCIIIIGGFNVVSVSQYIYASLLFLVPMILFFAMSSCNMECIKSFINFFVVICLVYAAFAIVLTTNYAFFMKLVGNSVDNYRYYSQYRASMMLGSSITVSYYLNLSLPLCFYVYCTSAEKKWKVISSLAIILNILATFVLLSRTATVCAILILLLDFLFVGNYKKNGGKKLVFVNLIIVAMLYAFNKYDLSRILTGLDFTSSSDLSRFTASGLGLYIFTQYPIFGSGMGRFFQRIYDYRYIYFDGMTALIDPHNMYVLIMSELGIMGLLVTIILFFNLFKSFLNIKEKVLRQTACITIIAFLFDSIGGSHMLNEISFSAIFWIYMGLFHTASIRNRCTLEYAIKGEIANA